MRQTPLASELAAQRLIDPLSGRRWRVSNPRRQNHMGQAVAYELVPGENVGLMASEDSEFARRAQFMTRHLWATPYRRDERYPAGEYPNQHAGGDGLPLWTAADRSLEDTDIVLWYVFGSHHVPRLEDWPVMPVVTCGFQLRPVGFFDRNPRSTCLRRRGTATPCSSTVEHRAHNPSGGGSTPPGGIPILGANTTGGR